MFRKILLILVACLPLTLLTDAGPAPAPEEDNLPPQTGEMVPGIVFVGAPIFDEETEGGKGVYQGSYHWRDSYIYARSATYHRMERTKGPVRPGKNLYALVPPTPDGKLTRLTHLKDGAVFKPEPHFDGKKVLFSMRRDGEHWFHLYEINIDGTGLKQLTDGSFNDFAGVYLPDDRIVFCSDRTGYLEEYHEERTETLFVMNPNGTGIKQITFMPGTYFEPTVLSDGRILFSFWDAFHIDVPPLDKHETILMTVNPDGTEERHFFGGGQYQFFNRERHSGIGLTQPREMLDGKILVQSEMGPSILDPEAGLAVEVAMAPIFPGTTSIQLGGTTHRAHLSPLGTRSTGQPLADGRFLFSGTQPGARDSAIYVCDPNTREEKLVYNIPNYAEFDAVPVGVKKPRPKKLPDRQKDVKENTTHFLIVAGKITDNPKRTEAMKKARFFRVIEAEYTAVTTSSHTNLATRILGTVPIHEDGSAFFEAPADTPLFLDPIDEGGNRVLMEWNYPDTSVEVGTWYPATQISYMVGRAGETKSCYGCHAPQTDAVPNLSLTALQYEPVKITRESTDLEYRRNEPEAYRLQARIGEQSIYGPWLNSDDPTLRARACEMLMYIEDGVAAEVPVIAELLQDENVQVKRAAALALTRLGTEKQRPALVAALKDADWQVRFSAQSALDALDLFKNYREELTKTLPDPRAFRAAGKARDKEAVKLLIPWLKNHKMEYHAAEAALALGRIGTPEAVDALWEAVRSEVPIKAVHISRYLQRGPRPEEYALIKALLLANANLSVEDIYLLITLIPNTFTEKPRFEDRLRDESQRMLMPRLMLEKNGYRKQVVNLLFKVLEKNVNTNDPIYQQLVKGVNLERPFSEHGRLFPVVQELGGEEALWLLSCFLVPEVDLDTAAKKTHLEALVVPYLTSESHRERIDSAVVLGISGFGPKAAAVLAREVEKAYAFPEITSIGQGMPGTPFRDKAYLVHNLARHVADVNSLVRFADAKTMYRDIRYGLVLGLVKRSNADAIPLLVKMAASDPLTVIRQQARYAVADIQDGYRLAGKAVPVMQWLPEQPLEVHYPPRGLTWADTSFVDLPPAPQMPPVELTGVEAYFKNCLQPENFRNFNMAQAKGADKMMVSHVEETRLAFAELGKHKEKSSQDALLAALDFPAPYARQLALKTLAGQRDPRIFPVLMTKLNLFVKQQDTVSFWWTCEAFGDLKAKEAIPLLVKYAQAENPANTFGPVGMPAGYVTAKNLARIIADPKDKEIVRLLLSDNVWLRAGVLRGLAEVNATGIEALLREAARPESPAVIRMEAQVQLARLGKGG
jgi:HEAT repeat protein